LPNGFSHLIEFLHESCHIVCTRVLSELSKVFLSALYKG
jgi:hypothetical protein